MTKNTRTDAHRPSTIVPAAYEQWNDYSLARDMIPAIGVDCAQPFTTYDGEGRPLRTVYPVCPDTGRCCVRSTEKHARAAGFAIFGAAGKCGVCGARFAYGTMFKHAPTGEIVHMGHDCAQKYELQADHSAWELENGRVERATAKAITRAQNAAERAAFLAEHPGLAEDLALGNADGSKGARILADMSAKLVQWKSLTEKQIAFCAKLASEIRNPAPAAPEEIKAPAPTGKGVEFTGEIVSAKLHESQGFGYNSGPVYTWKCTIVVRTEAGVWRAWGTVPNAVLDLAVAAADAQSGNREQLIAAALKGLRVDVKATLEAGSDRTDEYTGEVKRADPSFAFMKRPSMSIAGLYAPGREHMPKAKKPRAPKKACSVCEGSPKACAFC